MTTSTETSPARTIEDGAGSRLTWLGVEHDAERGDVLKVRNEVPPGQGPPMHTHLHQTEFQMDEIPTVATKVIIPLVVRLGRLLGRYERFADAPAPVGAGSAPR